MVLAPPPNPKQAPGTSSLHVPLSWPSSWLNPLDLPLHRWVFSCLPPLFPENDTIYWVDMGLSTISRAKRDQTWREDVVTNGIGRVEGIAVDWIAGEQRKGL